MTAGMPSYDDAEGMLQDQGLEVVVIPYRPSPAPPTPSSRPPGVRPSPGDLRAALASPASEECKACEGEEDCPSSPSSRRLLITPRTEAAIAEALYHRMGEATPPRAKATRGASPPRAAPHDGRTTETPAPAAARSHRESCRSAPAHGTAHGPRSQPTGRSASASASSAKHKKKHKDPNQKLGLYQMAKMGYQELCNAIIRPPRSNYSLEALGPEEFVFCGETFVRKDFGVVNERGLLVECSIWKKARGGDDLLDAVVDDIEDLGGGPREDPDRRGCGQITLNVDDWDENKEKGLMYLQVPESFEDESVSSSCTDGFDDTDAAVKDESRDDSQQNFSAAQTLRHQRSEATARSYYQGATSPRKRRRDPVVIYLHGNSSGRIEAVPQLGHLLSLGVAVVAFDFAGSGKSEGEFVSLGYYEREDLQTVIHHLRASGDISTIALWGRSMGAATALMYGSRDPTISCMILDSAFTDLTRLAEEMVERGKEQGVNVPNFVVSVALRMIKSSIKTQAGFSIRHISPISHVNRCFIPAMFVAGEHDDFIKKRHSETLHAKYAGDRNLVVVDGDHNSPRPRFLLQSACLFLQGCMQLNPTAELAVPLGTNLFAPPWSCPGTGSGRGAGLAAALARARSEAAAGIADERRWLAVHDAPPAREVQRQHSQPFAGRGGGAPPGLPLDGARSRSCDAASPTAECSPPDMSERQKEIQSSLFKMLGQQE